ncbi:Oidioi.mRNA.OKI2018_I69.chr2.g4468.t1.cds [Oikopleura dioica]|uniref:Oidioi.mRNA.OKI2018_I69.chr2.g4468.t1.cds n=1 Tax=Oikopleura dioica TaxID=34765 RepID=A0ABN7T2W4_OIKDI|nr:Oidioi.mRNA.OKI2018_I69.chr2.g4468.t1.cds [Oikopleura dioica]
MSVYRQKDYILLKLHECQEKFIKLQEIYEFDDQKSPVNLTLELLEEDFPVKDGSKKYQQRVSSLKNSCDALPMHVVLVNKNFMTQMKETEIEIVGHCRLLCVAGKSNMTFIDDFVIRKQYRAQGFGRYLFKSLEEFLKLELDQDSFGIASKTEIDRSFFRHMGMNKLDDGQKIPYIDVQEGQLLNKLNKFFSGRIQKTIFPSNNGHF